MNTHNTETNTKDKKRIMQCMYKESISLIQLNVILENKYV